VNGDGFADLVVATSAESLIAVYVFPGGAAGLAATPMTALFLPNVDATNLSVASAGDVNGDGYADLVVSALSTDLSSSSQAYVYLGGPSGLAMTPATTITFGDSTATTATAVVTSAGDVNGDGFGDLVASYFIDDASGFTAGGYVYLGSKTGIATAPSTKLAGVFLSTDGGGGSFNSSISGAGDVNGDGYADIIAAACDTDFCAWVYLGTSTGIDPKPAATITPASGGVGSLASAGDVNGDGYGDVAVEEVTPQGAAFLAVYLGSASGLATTPASTPTEPESMVDGFGFGGSFGSAGDVNGDGFADLVAGAPDGVPGDASVNLTGSAYIYLGSASGLAATAGSTLVGTEGEEGLFGSSVFGASD
jgi:FG-GAP-like repeat/FG-GAP repeat